MDREVYIENQGKYLLFFLLEGEKLLDFRFQSLTEPRPGSIYRGKITDKIPSLDAFFVDIGQDKNGFLPMSKEDFDRYNEGDSIIVELVTPPKDDKPSKLTINYELSNDYLVLLKNSNIRKISRKIRGEEAQDIYNIFDKNIEDYGFIIRTKSANKTKNQVLEIIKDSLNSMNELEKEENFLPSPKLLRSGPCRILKDIEGKKITTNYKRIYDELKDQSDIDIFLDPSFSYKYMVNLSREVRRLSSKKIIIEDGSNFIIEKTKAFYVIDVNSGGLTNKNKYINVRDQVNFQLAPEIIRQIYFRNLSGEILIDFISFSSKTKEKEFLAYIKSLAVRNTNPLVVLGFSHLGILECRRKKYGEVFEPEKVFK